MNTENRVLKSSQQKILAKTFNGNARFTMGAFLLLADVVSFLLAGFLAIVIRVIFERRWQFELFPQIVPVLVVSVIFFGFIGLYPAVGISHVEELRKLVTMTTLVVIALAALSFWIRNAQDYSRLTLALTWMFSVVLLPFGREAVRTVCISLKMWGEPVALIGYGKQGHWALQYFRRNIKLGLNPVVVLDLSETNEHTSPNILILRVNDLLLGQTFEQLTGVKTAILILSDVPSEFTNYIISSKQGGFDRLILIPSLEQISSYGVVSFDFGGVLGLEVRHSLLDIRQQALKRIVDLVLVLVGGIVISPVLGVLALLVALDSGGSIFYGQSRIGKGGRKFKAWKFRTMVKNADIILKDYLDKYPALKKEWETSYKLKNDPRVTRFGSFMRKYSLDEFPQLFNILKGEMSLVGPRPIVDDEIRQYGDKFDPYTWVRPGLTGMWQVSGRSDTAYNERVHLDEYYVRNWSIWLDIDILVRTIVTVIKKDGAY